MIKSKTNIAAALAVILGLSMALLSAPVSAGKRDPSPPPGGQRDVIADAGKICIDVDVSMDLIGPACELRRQTDGTLDPGVGCPVGDGTSAGVVTYLLRNCDKNEESLLRYASSAVLSLDDFLEREKIQQATTAANYLCGYADKYALLVGAGKLVATEDEDLGEDAKDLADAITGTDSYCDQ